MDAPIPDFTEAEQQLVAELLRQRYGNPVSMQLADTELALDTSSDKLTACPTLYWSARGAQFVVCKVAENRYRSQFFYSDADHYGTGRDEYDGLEECAVTLLQVQSDHERQSAGAGSAATAADVGTDDYHGPVIA